MSLFDGQALTEQECHKPKRLLQIERVTFVDKKGRAWRRRPYWIDLGKGPEGKTCKSCRFLLRYERAKVYWKCKLWKVTGGPGTGIASTDHCCSRYCKRGMAMLTIKNDGDYQGIQW